MFNKKVNNRNLGFVDRLIPHYKEMWQIGANQNWKCIDCKIDISHDPEWVCHLDEDVATCEKCGRKRWGSTITDGFGKNV